MFFRHSAIVALLTFSLTGQARAGKELPPQQQALLLLRTLAYDRNVKSRSGATVNIALLSRDGTCSQMRDALIDASKQLTVGGLPVKVIVVEWSAKEGEAKLAAVRPAAAYLCGELSGAIDALTTVTHKLSVLTFSPDSGDVANGVSIGLVNRGDKAALLVNLPASKSEGAELDSAVLRVAEIIGM